MSDPADLKGKRVGRYSLVSHLASGGMAEIYVARQESVGGFQKDLVLKTIAGRWADNERVVKMFHDEARLAATLSHPNIVHIYDVGEEDGFHYIAMEYIHGETVADIVRRSIEVGRYLPLEHAALIISQTAEGLAHAHDHKDAEGRLQRIAHRDVSPSNLLVSYEGQAKIVDFGIARAEDEAREEAGMRPGKVSYMSPEQVKGEGADYRSDIYALGVVLYEITLGKRLWKGPPEVLMRRIVEDKIPPPTVIKRDYPPALELVVMKALERAPKDRYQSAVEMHHDLDDFLAESGLRTGSRWLAQYLKEIFAPETQASQEGLLRAREFDGPDAPGPDVSEEIDLDRRPVRTEAVASTTEVFARRPVATPAGPVPEAPRAEPQTLGASVAAALDSAKIELLRASLPRARKSERTTLREVPIIAMGDTPDPVAAAPETPVSTTPPPAPFGENVSRRRGGASRWVLLALILGAIGVGIFLAVT